MKVFDRINSEIEGLNIETISLERKGVLQPLIDYLQHCVSRNQTAKLNFICTHNSRRSHLSQVWAQTFSYYFSVHTECYSGGTEATALFPMVAKTLKSQGFEIEKLAETYNPIYSIKYTSNELPIIGFSKKLDDSFNPSTDFAAIMTCSQADQGCPIVTGANVRIPITFEDPKAFDDTPQQQEKYLERSIQIATEMKYVFSKVKSNT